METLLQNVRLGMRSLRRTPGFTVTALLTLALGIGLATAVFTVAAPSDSASAASCARTKESSPRAKLTSHAHSNRSYRSSSRNSMLVSAKTSTRLVGPYGWDAVDIRVRADELYGWLVTAPGLQYAPLAGGPARARPDASAASSERVTTRSPRR